MQFRKYLLIQKQSKLYIDAYRSNAPSVSAVLLAVTSSLILATSSQAQQLFPLRGHGSLHPGIVRTKALAHLDSNSKLDLAVSLPVRNQTQLDNTITALYDPKSPSYHKYYTTQQFNDTFAPTKADYDKLTSFLKTSGFTVKKTHKNRMIVDVNGSVGNIEQTFHVKMNKYQHPTENRTFIAADREPTVAQQVPILDVSGLDNFELPRPKNLHRSVPSFSPDSTGSAPGDLYMGYDFRAAYTPGTSLDGTGQTIALLETGHFFQSDIDSYCSIAGLPPSNITVVTLDGSSGLANPGDATLEQSIDIEVAHAMAPGANILFYTNGNFVDIWNQIAEDNIAKEVSASWSAEIDPSTLNQILQQMAAQRQSVFNGCGDNGFDIAPFGWDDNPYMTQVGGTVLTTSGPLGPRIAERAWDFGGGSVSSNYAIPTWQQGIDMSANGGSTTMRNCPDVAMTADSVYITYNNGQTINTGGTSAAAPLWAGYLAMANQQAAMYGKPPAGFINPAIYAIGKSSSYGANFFDITDGNNGMPAVAGYDLVTGWGSPGGQNLINALSGTFGTPAYYQIINKYSGLAIDLIGGDTSNGAVTNLWTPTDNDTNQLWSMQLTDDNQHFKIVSGVTGKVLYVANDSSDLGTQIWDWDYIGDPNQMWDLVDSGGGWYRIKNVNTGLVLDNSGYGTSNDTELDQWSDNLTNGAGQNPDNQAWRFQNTVYDNTLHAPSVLPSGRQLIEGNHTLVMQADGNLVEYNGGSSIWASNTDGHPGAYLAMQTDGNLVIYDQSGTALWSSSTNNNPGAYLTLQSDGNLVVYSSANSSLWANNRDGQ